MTTPAVGIYSKAAICSSLAETVRPLLCFEYLDEGVGKTRVFLPNSETIHGTRSQTNDRARYGTFTVAGQIRCNPNPSELQFWLPFALGGPTGDYSLTPDIPYFHLWVNRVTRLFRYNFCKVDKLTLRSSEGQPLEMILDIVGRTEDVILNSDSDGVFLAGLSPPAGQPYAFFDSFVTITGNTSVVANREVKDVEIIVDNMLKKDRFLNTQFLTEAIPLGRTVNFNCTPPYDLEYADLYPMQEVGVPVLVTFLNTGDPAGAKILSLSFGCVKFPEQPFGTLGARDEIYLSMKGTAFKSGSTLEMVTSIANVGP